MGGFGRVEMGVGGFQDEQKNKKPSAKIKAEVFAGLGDLLFSNEFPQEGNISAVSFCLFEDDERTQFSQMFLQIQLSTKTIVHQRFKLDLLFNAHFNVINPIPEGPLS